MKATLRDGRSELGVAKMDMPDDFNRRKYRVMIVDDHPLIREGLSAVIDKQSDMEVCGEAETATEALEKLQDDADIILIDVLLPDFSGIELVERLKRKRPTLPTLVISGHDKEIYKERALEAGASGYIDKKDAATELIPAIRHLLNGRRRPA